MVRTGDVEAFEVLVDRYHGPLTRRLVYRVNDSELGADLAQDILPDAFRRKLGSFGIRCDGPVLARETGPQGAGVASS